MQNEHNKKENTEENEQKEKKDATWTPLISGNKVIGIVKGIRIN